MSVLVGSLLLLVGLVMLARAVRTDFAVRSWTHAPGTVTAARPAHLSDDGRQWWDLQVAFRDAGGQEHQVGVRELGHRVPDRTGERVDVWYDPARPERSRVVLGENAPGSPRLAYALGGALLVAGAAVLVLGAPSPTSPR